MLVLAGIYGALAIAYLLVIPFIAMQYLDSRWNVSSGWEKVFMFFLIFFLFPGMIVIGPFRNFRPKRRSV